MRIFEMNEGREIKERLRYERRDCLYAARRAIESCRFEETLPLCAELIARDGIGCLDPLYEDDRLARGPEGLRFIWRMPDLPFATGIFTWVARTLLYLGRDVASFEPVFGVRAGAFFVTIPDTEPLTTPAQIWANARPWLNAAFARETPWRPVDGRIKRA